MAWQARVVEWITQEESALPNRHLIAQNYSNFRLPVRKLLPNVDVVNFHYAYPEAVLLNYDLGKAISYDETGFLGREDDAYRRQAWNFMLSGGSVFGALDYSFTTGHEDGSFSEPNGPGGGSPTLRHQLRVLSEFLQSFSLVDLQPDTHTVKHAAGTTARDAFQSRKAICNLSRWEWPHRIDPRTATRTIFMRMGECKNRNHRSVGRLYPQRRQEASDIARLPERNRVAS